MEIKPSHKILITVFSLAAFVVINLLLYFGVTARLGNNYSDTSQIKMIDVQKYLPFEDASELVHVDTDFSIADELPILDGAAALVPVYASIIENVYPEGAVTYIDGQFSDDNYYGENFAPDSAMQYKNTIRGFEAVVNGETDIFFSAMPSAEQQEYAADKGVELQYIPIGKEAFIFFVNANNPVEDLSVEQIRKIYSGEYKNWKAVGGVDRAINPVTRVEGSGSRTMMDYFMGEVPYGRKSAMVVTGASIGYSFRYYFTTMVDNTKVKMISVNGVYPDIESIRNNEYPIVTQFYAVYRTDNDNPNIAKLIDWILSDEGQELIEKCGYVTMPVDE